MDNPDKRRHETTESYVDKTKPGKRRSGWAVSASNKIKPDQDRNWQPLSASDRIQLYLCIYGQPLCASDKTISNQGRQKQPLSASSKTISEQGRTGQSLSTSSRTISNQGRKKQHLSASSKTFSEQGRNGETFSASSKTISNKGRKKQPLSASSKTFSEQGRNGETFSASSKTISDQGRVSKKPFVSAENKTISDQSISEQPVSASSKTNPDKSRNEQPVRASDRTNRYQGRYDQRTIVSNNTNTVQVIEQLVSTSRKTISDQARLKQLLSASSKTISKQGRNEQPSGDSSKANPGKARNKQIESKANKTITEQGRNEQPVSASSKTNLGQVRNGQLVSTSSKTISDQDRKKQLLITSSKTISEQGRNEQLVSASSKTNPGKARNVQPVRASDRTNRYQGRYDLEVIVSHNINLVQGRNEQLVSTSCKTISDQGRRKQSLSASSKTTSEQGKNEQSLSASSKTNLGQVRNGQPVSTSSKTISEHGRNEQLVSASSKTNLCQARNRQPVRTSERTNRYQGRYDQEVIVSNNINLVQGRNKPKHVDHGRNKQTNSSLGKIIPVQGRNELTVKASCTTNQHYQSRGEQNISCLAKNNLGKGTNEQILGIPSKKNKCDQGSNKLTGNFLSTANHPDFSTNGQRISPSANVNASHGRLDESVVDVNTVSNIKDREETNLTEPSFEISQETDYRAGIEVAKVGTIVWGWLSKTRWWPAIIVDGPSVNQPPARPDCFWIMWFEDYKIAMLTMKQLELFGNSFQMRTIGKRTEAHDRAVTEALQVSAARLGVSLDEPAHIRAWVNAPGGFLHVINTCPQEDQLAPISGEEFPERFLTVLNRLSRKRRLPEDEDIQDEEDIKVWQEPKLELIDHQLEPQPSRYRIHRTPECHCMNCSKPMYKYIYQHPLFEGRICKKCKDRFMETTFWFAEDGSGAYCSICSGAEMLKVCHGHECARSFCETCINKFVFQDDKHKIKDMPRWRCFLCKKYKPWTHGNLKPRANWQEQLLQAFNPVENPSQQEKPGMYMGKNNRGIRVLTLFDGACAVKEALDQLGIQVEQLYTITTSPLVTPSKTQGIIELGDIRKITQQMLREIAPIDLLFGTPLINNWNDVELSMSSILHRMYHLRKEIFLANGCETHVFWLVEWPVTVPHTCIRAQARVLGDGPSMWDAQYFSSVVLPRYFWGNLPGLHSSLSYYKEVHNKSSTEGTCKLPKASQVRFGTAAKLPEDVLEIESSDEEESDTSEEEDEGNGSMKSESSSGDEEDYDFCYRLVYDLPNNYDSQPQEMEVDPTPDELYTGELAPVDIMQPVLMNDQRSEVPVEEVERLLGFPENYTDASADKVKRVQLIGRTSVEVLKHLLAPLKEIFDGI